MLEMSDESEDEKVSASEGNLQLHRIHSSSSVGSDFDGSSDMPGLTRRDSKLLELRQKVARVMEEIEQGRSDALQDYIELTISAIKVNFANVSVKYHELYNQTKGMPFHRIHDKLVCFMITKMKRDADQCARCN